MGRARAFAQMRGYVRALTKSSPLKLRALLFLTGEDSPSCVYSLVFPFDLCLFPVFLIEWILALLRAVCPFPSLQLCNCRACWDAGDFSSLGGGFLFPAIPPVVCFAPGLSLPTCTAGNCLILLMGTVPCRCLNILPFTWPACSYTHGINALCQLQLPLWSRSSALKEVFGDSTCCPCS